MTSENEKEEYERILDSTFYSILQQVKDFNTEYNKNFVIYKIFVDLLSVHLEFNSIDHEEVIKIIGDDIRESVESIKNAKKIISKLID